MGSIPAGSTTLTIWKCGLFYNQLTEKFDIHFLHPIFSQSFHRHSTERGKKGFVQVYGDIKKLQTLCARNKISSRYISFALSFMRDYSIKYHIPLHLIVFPLQITYKLRDTHFRVFLYSKGVSFTKPREGLIQNKSSVLHRTLFSVSFNTALTPVFHTGRWFWNVWNRISSSALPDVFCSLLLSLRNSRSRKTGTSSCFRHRWTSLYFSCARTCHS